MSFFFWACVVCGVALVILRCWPMPKKKEEVETKRKEPVKEEGEDNRLRAWVNGKEVKIERMPPKSETYSNRGFEFPDDPDFSNRNF